MLTFNTTDFAHLLESGHTVQREKTSILFSQGCWSKDLWRQLNGTELVLLYRTTVRITLKEKRVGNSIIWDTVTTATLHKGAELQGNWSLRPISPAFLLYRHYRLCDSYSEMSRRACTVLTFYATTHQANVQVTLILAYNTRGLTILPVGQ